MLTSQLIRLFKVAAFGCLSACSSFTDPALDPARLPDFLIPAPTGIEGQQPPLSANEILVLPSDLVRWLYSISCCHLFTFMIIRIECVVMML